MWRLRCRWRITIQKTAALRFSLTAPGLRSNYTAAPKATLTISPLTEKKHLFAFLQVWTVLASLFLQTGKDRQSRGMVEGWVERGREKEREMALHTLLKREKKNCQSCELQAAQTAAAPHLSASSSLYLLKPAELKAGTVCREASQF